MKSTHLIKTLIRISSSLFAAAFGVLPLAANPTGMTLGATNAPSGTLVVAPTLVFNGSELIVNQNYSRMVLNWSDFSINAGESVRFAQPDSASAVLNRVTGGNPSTILGQLTANGSVFLINPNGVLVGASGVIQTGGTFAASTRDLTNAEFITGGALNFIGTAATGVENLGLIKSDNGDVVLIGRTVKNRGTVEAVNGRAGLAAGDDVVLSSTGNDRLSVRLPTTVVATGVTGVDNTGTVKAAQAQLTAAGGNVYTLAVSNGGLVEATGVTTLPDGRVVLTSEGGDIAHVGSGELRAANANGDGGRILVGGGTDGGDAAVVNARKVTLGDTTLAAISWLKANATSATGNGGRITVWSETETDATFRSGFEAKAGASGGDGGTVEIGSRSSLVSLRGADVNAPAGQDGWVRYTAPSFAITNDTLIPMLQARNLELNTDITGSTGTGDITISGTPMAYGVSAILERHGLKLDARRDIIVNGPLHIYNQNIPSNAARVQGPGFGAITFEAGRDIALNADLRVTLTTEGGSHTMSLPGNSAGPAVAAGAFTFNAGRNITSTATLQFSGTSNGGTAGAGVGGQGGVATLGAMAMTAAGDITLANLEYSGSSQGGSGGPGNGGLTGGAGGAVTLGGLTVDAGGTLRTTGTLTLQGTSRGGIGGARAGVLNPTVRDGGIGGVAGNVALGAMTLEGNDLDLQGATNVSLASLGGKGSSIVLNQSPSVVGIGGAAGDVSGTIGFNATRDILSLGSALKIAASQGTKRGDDNAQNPAFNNELGGAGGAAGNVSLPAVTIAAGRNLSSATTSNSLQANVDLTLKAGGNLTLTNTQVTGSRSLTLVADDAHPTDPAYGTGAVTLSNTQLLSRATHTTDWSNASPGSYAGGDNTGVRVFGVSPSRVSLGTLFTPAATGTANQYYGAGGTTAGGLYYKAIITADPLTIRANDFNLTYGFSTLPAFTASYTGLLSGDAVTNLQFSTLAAVGSNVGTYAITPSNATLSGTGNYAISYVAGLLTVNPATLNITGTSFSKVYGAAMPALTATSADLKNGDTLAAVANLNATTAATAGSNVGNYTFSLAPTLLIPSGATVPNYTLGTVTGGNITVTRAPLIIQADSFARAYGAANPALTAAFNGLVNGDTSAVVSNFGLGTTATPASVGGAYPITQTGAASAVNYQITFLPGTLTVGNPDYLTITANNTALTYGFAALPAFTASYAGFVSSHTAANVTGLQFATTASLGSNAGTYAITPYGATAPSNYAINYVNGTLTVNPAVLNVGVNNAAKAYGAALPAFTSTVTGLVNGDTASAVVAFAPTTTATVGSAVGTYAITPGATLNTGNYTLGTQTAGVLTVGPATLNVAANNTSTSYGAAIPALTGTATGLVNQDTQTAVVAFAPTTTATLGSNAGTYVIVPNATLLGATPNYAFGTIANGLLTINPAQLIVIAADATRAYGAANPTFSASVSGLVNHDTQASVVTLAPATTATVGSNAGTYLIQPNATLLSSNYAIASSNPGRFTITPARLDLSGSTFAMAYGGAGTPSATATGLVNGDKLADVLSLRYGSLNFDGTFVPYDFSTATVRQYDYAINDYRPWTYNYPVLAGLLTPNYTLGTVNPGTFTVTPREVTVSLQGFDISRAIRSYSTGLYGNINGQVSGNQLTIRASDGALFNPETNGGTLPYARFVVTFDGMTERDLAANTAQNYSVYPILGHAINRPLADGSQLTGPVITGLQINPNWRPGENYTFKWVQPTAADLHFMPYTPVSVTMIDIATIMGNPSLYPVYAFTGDGLGAANGLDLTSNRFGYRTNWNSGSQSGVYWYSPTLPASIDPGTIPYPSSTTDSPNRIDIPLQVNSNGSLNGVFWWNSQLKDADLLITRLNPGKVNVYNFAGELNAANNQARGDYWLLRDFEDRESQAREEATRTTKGKQSGVTTTTALLVAGDGHPRFDLSSGSVMGYPAYQATEVYGAVALFLQRAGKASDRASVTNWIRQNDTETGRQAIFGVMTEYITTLATTTISAQEAELKKNPILGPSLNPFARATPTTVRTPGQQKLLDTVAEAIRSNRIAAYKKVEADYKAWQDDVRRTKEGKMPTMYNLIDLGETPPDSLVNQLGLAKTGLSDAELRATGTVVGGAISAATTAVGLTALATTAGGYTGATAAAVSGSLMPFANAATASIGAIGPAIAATFVAIVAADAAVKVMKIEKFKDDLDDLRDRAYGQPTVASAWNNGSIGQAEVLNALRELNGW